MDKLICSYCGKDRVSIEVKDMVLSDPYGGTATVKIKEKVCTHCGFAEEDDNDLVIQEGLTALKRISMVKMIETLNSMGHTTAAMERALELPARTLARWKNEQSISPSAAGVALMRIIRTFPWILAVADSQFDPEVARIIFIKNVVEELEKISLEHPRCDTPQRA